jgi:organic radical activating enzyme
MFAEIDHRSLYRLPWSLSDNPIAWLEPTQHCNLACDGCYRMNVKEHCDLATVDSQLETFARLRNFDGISIAGGDPLTHPDVVEIVRRVKAMGRKAIINTNGLALTRAMLRELKSAGLDGITFHVDSRQGRPGWKHKTEKETNELRQTYADMVADVGDVSCAFNSTVYEDTLDQVNDVADWAARNIDKVHTVVFILFRAAHPEKFDYYAGGRRVDVDPLVYAEGPQRRTDIQAQEIVARLRARDPRFAPSAYLNGTEKPDSFKWLLTTRVGTPERIHGYLGPRFMEVVQSAYHLARGRYLSYAAPSLFEMGRSAMLGGATFDPLAREALASWGKSVFLAPWKARETLHVQSVVVIQPIDLLPDGRQNMCDGCPDMTLHEGQLVWSCRLEEPREYGCFLRSVPKEKRAAQHLPVVTG